MTNWWTIFGVLIVCNECVNCLRSRNDFQSYVSGGRRNGTRPSPNSNSLNDDSLIHELQSEKFGKFDHDLLSELSRNDQGKNIVVSPTSMKSLLSLLVEGSSGDTVAEILQTLQLQDQKGGIPVLRKLQSLLRNDRSSITLKSGNKIYKASDVSVKKDYETTLKSIYYADIETLDFSNPELASDVINQKVNAVTHGLIRSVVDQDMINTETRLFLLNYVYLKASWDIAFNPRATRARCFYTTPGKCQQVKFMYQKRALNFTDSEGYKSEIFEIPFKDSRYRIVFMLPHKGTTVYDVLKILDRKGVHESFKELADTSVNLYLPRTVVEYSGNMVGTLRKLGVNSVFGPSAKLDNMVKNERLSVGNVVHKARIEINEEGAEGSAVSGGNIQFLSLDTDRNVIVDRPFLFFIRDTAMAGFLFEGVVITPDLAR